MSMQMTHIDFGIKSDQLRMEQITALLGISPTSGFNPNEPYVGKMKVRDVIVEAERNRPDFGVWHYSTERLISSDLLEDHAHFLLDALRDAKVGINQLLRSPEYEVALTLWHVGPSGFDISSETMAQLAAVSKRISVVCFEV